MGLHNIVFTVRSTLPVPTLAVVSPPLPLRRHAGSSFTPRTHRDGTLRASCLPYRWPPWHYPCSTWSYPPTCPIWSCNARTRRLAAHRLALWYPPLGCVSVLHPGLQRGPNNGRRPAGRLVHNTSLEYSRYIRVALMPILSLSETVTVSTGLGLNKAAVWAACWNRRPCLETFSHGQRERCATLARELGRSPRCITLLNFPGFPSHEVSHCPPACTVYRPRPLTPWPKPSKAAGSMPVTGRALLGLSRLAVSNRLQPVSLRYANHASLHQPCTRRTHPERDTQRRADTNARLTLGHLTWPIALSDRTGLPPREEKPHRVQPGSTRVYTRAWPALWADPISVVVIEERYHYRAAELSFRQQASFSPQ